MESMGAGMPGCGLSNELAIPPPPSSCSLLHALSKATIQKLLDEIKERFWILPLFMSLISLSLLI